MYKLMQDETIHARVVLDAEILHSLILHSVECLRIVLCFERFFSNFLELK